MADGEESPRVEAAVFVCALALGEEVAEETPAMLLSLIGENLPSTWRLLEHPRDVPVRSCWLRKANSLW
ncbi:unnamed protein product, partial [Iphiclides podalirius]